MIKIAALVTLARNDTANVIASVAKQSRALRE
jgi:hypothetical protein